MTQQAQSRAQSDLAAHVWPPRAKRDGEITIGGVAATELAGRFGTPLMVLDEHAVRSRASRVREAFESVFDEVGVYYAGKALLNGAVAQWMLDAGLGIDVCSGGELAIALAAGAPPERIGVHGNNKSVTEIEAAVAAGVGAIVIDAPIEIERIADAASRAGVRQRVRLRINVGVHASTHEFLATSHEDQKFGVPLAVAPELAAQIREHDSLEFVGLHTHIGSQIFASDGFAEAARRMLRLHAELSRDEPLPELNLGGGFGIAYVESETPIDVEEVAAELALVVRDECASLGIAVPKVLFEPGRWIVGPAGVTLYEVGVVKPVAIESGTRTYVAVDGGMSDNLRTALYGAAYTARIASRHSGADVTLARVVGKHCESGDIVVDQALLPCDIAPGDLLAVAATGAYCVSLSSNYNALPRPAIVAVADGEARAIVRRETLEDVCARDLVLQQP